MLLRCRREEAKGYSRKLVTSTEDFHNFQYYQTLYTHTLSDTYLEHILNKILLTLSHENEFFFPMLQQSLVGQCLFIVDAPRSHSNTSHSVGIL